MKKALSLILALVMCAALGVPAFAADLGPQLYYPGVNADAGIYNEDGTTDVVNPAQMSVTGWLDSDASVLFIPTIPATDAPAADVYYTVQVGDTLEAISFAYYGTTSLAGALREYNKNGHFLQSGGILEATRALRIPATLKGYTRLAEPYPVIPAWAGPVQLDDGTILYPVQQGDTLKKIAATFYAGRSDAFIVNSIATVNGLANANRIYAGMVLVLPLINVGL